MNSNKCDAVVILGSSSDEGLAVHKGITETNYINAGIIGNGLEMQRVFYLISCVSMSDSTVLVQGETGTGKELIVKAIHNNSPRKEKPMIKVNCAALPADLIESELFGHERGSFTGATEQRVGKFEQANHGTLFLDEIGEMPLDLQSKLLRAIQEREIERIGGKSTIRLDIRIIVATNRDLKKEVKEGRFRSDLYYRLSVFPITVPPLRNRKEDIKALISYFISKYSRKTGKKIIGISNPVQQELLNYRWPGNIRELEHQIERSIILTTGNIIKDMDLPVPKGYSYPRNAEDYVSKTIDENERDHIIKTLQKCKGKIAGADGAAYLLGVPPSTLNSKIQRFNISKDEIFDPMWKFINQGD